MITNSFLRIGCYKKCLLPILLFFICLQAYSQSCDCPALDSCDPCEGGLTSLTLQYTGGLLNLTIEARDGGGRIYYEVLNDGAIFTVTSSIAGEPFVGDYVELSGDLINNELIITSCDNQVFAGTVYDNFTVIGGESLSGGTICCSVNDMETNVPVISGCPADINISSDADCIAVADWTTPTATDDCGIPTLTSTHVPGENFAIGTTTVTYTATDDYGNTSTCFFNVVVSDKISPTFSGCISSDIIVSADDDACQASVTWTPPEPLDCQAVSLSSSHAPGAIFSLGTTKVTYTATDGSGNSAICSFNVIVKDETLPQIIGCKAGTVIEATASITACESIVEWALPSVTDNCNVTLTSNYHSGDTFPFGTTEVIYTAGDASGNISTCKFKVKVKDRTAPEVLGCIRSDINVTTDLDSCFMAVIWTEPTATDNCEMSMAIRSHAPGDLFPVGTTLVTYTFADNSGNTSTCSFNVVVNGNGSSEGAPVLSHCPEDIVVKAGGTGEQSVEWIPPTATAACGVPALTVSHAPGDIFSIGTTTVTYKATDARGMTSLCTFNVDVSYEELEIAKLITPDGNGSNDEWLITNIERFNDNRIMIVDRWGSIIFSASGYNNENVVWKGVSQDGVMVPTGTYFYTISFKVGSKTIEKRGFIELIR